MKAETCELPVLSRMQNHRLTQKPIVITNMQRQTQVGVILLVRESSDGLL